MQGTSIYAVYIRTVDSIPLEMIEKHMQEANLVTILGFIALDVKEQLQPYTMEIMLVDALKNVPDSGERKVEDLTELREIVAKHYKVPFPKEPIPEDPILLEYIKKYGAAATYGALNTVLEELSK